MNFTKLYYFKIIADFESTSKASKELFISQPALSKALKDLENDVGYKLFNRHGKKLELNEYGKKLLELTNNLLVDMGKIKGELEKVKEGKCNSLKIITDYKIFLKLVLEEVYEHYPQIHTKGEMTNHIDVQELTYGETDIIISSFYPEELERMVPFLQKKSIHYIYLLQENLYLITPKCNEIPLNREVSIQQLINYPEPFIRTIDKDLYLNKWIDDLLKIKKCDLSYVHEMDGETLQKIKYTTDYFYFTSSLFIGMKKYNDFRKCRNIIKICDPEATKNICIFYLKKDYNKLSPIIKLLIDNFYNEFIL